MFSDGNKQAIIDLLFLAINVSALLTTRKYRFAVKVLLPTNTTDWKPHPHPHPFPGLPYCKSLGFSTYRQGSKYRVLVPPRVLNIRQQHFNVDTVLLRSSGVSDENFHGKIKPLLQNAPFRLRILLPFVAPFRCRKKLEPRPFCHLWGARRASPALIWKSPLPSSPPPPPPPSTHTHHHHHWPRARRCESGQTSQHPHATIKY